MAGRPLKIAKAHRLLKTAAARELRISAGLSLADVAEGVGVTAGAVHAWEHGRYLPRGDHAVRYARLLADLESLARR
jgi:transcriptional regulator with XRE-family HTH domain